MANLVLYASGASFVTALILGVVLEASRSTVAMGRLVTRHQAEVRRLREELTVCRSRENEKAA
jgi:hypothetical protein